MESRSDMEIDDNSIQTKNVIPMKLKVIQDGFKIPLSRQIRKKSKNELTQGIPFSNSFCSLSDADPESSVASLKRKDLQIFNSQTRKPPHRSNLVSSISRLRTVGQSTKPIQVPNTTFTTMQSLLMSFKLSKRPEVRNHFGKFYLITPFSIHDKSTIITKLKELSSLTTTQ